jgi:hypothetical protein
MIKTKGYLILVDHDGICFFNNSILELHSDRYYFYCILGMLPPTNYPQENEFRVALF